MHKKIAIVFPGQGSQSVGMLQELALEFTTIKKIFAEASAILNCDLWELAQTGGEKFAQTEWVQPLLLTADIAVWQLYVEQGGKIPQFLAGHSLGEYAALVAAKTLDFATALRLVQVRGKLMQEAVPVGEGGMVAIVGLDENQILEICAEVAMEDLISIANYNSVGQIVLAGTMNACKHAVELAEKNGAKIAKLLAVSVPSHCKLMKPTAMRFARYLKAVAFSRPEINVIHNIDVSCYDEPDKIREALVKQLYSPVRWVETILFMINHGVGSVLECGPGKVLTGLNKRISKDVEVEFLGLPNNFRKGL